MKRIYTYIMIAAGLLSACQEYHIDSQADLPPTVRTDALNEDSVLAASPSRIVFNISANTPWTIETDSQWCIPTPAMSASSSLVSEIIINTEDNQSTEPRTATLTVSAEELGVVKTISIAQAGMTEPEPQVIDDPDTPDNGLDVTFSEGASYLVVPSTGYTKIYFTKGEILRTDYTVKKGRFVIEFDEMKMTSICNLGFVFVGTTTAANFKFHIEGDYTYWFRCAGAFSWISPIKKTYTFDEVNAIRRLEFVVSDSSTAEGLLDISLYINGELYGTQAGRTDAFANGEEGCVFCIETGADPAEGDYCTIKSITYTSEES